MYWAHYTKHIMLYLLKAAITRYSGWHIAFTLWGKESIQHQRHVEIRQANHVLHPQRNYVISVFMTITQGKHARNVHSHIHTKTLDVLLPEVIQAMENVSSLKPLTTDMFLCYCCRVFYCTFCTIPLCSSFCLRSGYTNSGRPICAVAD